MTMREAVARALLASETNGEMQWDDLDLFTRGAFLRDADAAIAVVRDHLKPRLQHDEEGVLEMLEGGCGPLEDSPIVARATEKPSHGATPEQG